MTNLSNETENKTQELSEVEVRKRTTAHAILCEEKEFPNFVSDGKCFSCGRNVFERYNGTQPITGCPFCYSSFCN